MFSKLTIFALALIFAGCSSVVPVTSGTWRASVANGDKPGVGIEISRAQPQVSGFMFILDPNKPHDFDAGRRLRMQIHISTEQQIRFAVQGMPDEMVLRFLTPLAGSSFRGELQSADGKDSPTDFEFRRIR